MQKLLYFYPISTSFVQADLILLRENYDVRSFYFNGSAKLLTPFYFIAQLIFVLYHLPTTYKMVAQFSGYHSYIPALFSKFTRKHMYIILHGTECNNFPEYNYGYLKRKLLYWFANNSMMWATKLLPVSEALVSSIYRYAPTKHIMQGYKHFYPDVSTPYEVIYNGVSSEKFAITNYVRKPNTFLTIATGLQSANRRAIKGLDLIIELATLTPENEYTFIGAENKADLKLPPNITVLGYIPNDELINSYNQHAFYLQLSASEGFGISVCEAMLCGCIPIVSNVGVLPFIAGEKGHVLNFKDVDTLKELIDQAKIDYDQSHMDSCRLHIISHFEMRIRKSRLYQILD